MQTKLREFPKYLELKMVHCSQLLVRVFVNIGVWWNICGGSITKWSSLHREGFLLQCHLEIELMSTVQSALVEMTINSSS